jgi:hypothetical protein
MTDNLDPEAYLEFIRQKMDAEFYGPRRQYTLDQINQVVAGLPLLPRIVLLEVRDGRSYWQIAWKYRMWPRRVEKEYAKALVGLLRGFRALDGEE